MNMTLVAASGKPPARAGAERSQLARAKVRVEMLSWLEAHSADPAITAAQLAEVFGVSVRQLHIVFSEDDVHGTFFRSLQYLRMKRASVLLKDPALKDLPVKQVAHRCGYLDFSAFSRTFKLHFGITAADYRKRLRDAGGGGVIFPQKRRRARLREIFKVLDSEG